MAFENSAMNATLVAAAGEDAVLLAELRAAFSESLDRQVDLLSRARCDGNWTVAAQRLKGLGASFHAPRLVALAEEALDSAPGEPGIIRKLTALSREFAVS